MFAPIAMRSGHVVSITLGSKEGGADPSLERRYAYRTKQSARNNSTRHSSTVRVQSLVQYEYVLYRTVPYGETHRNLMMSETAAIRLIILYLLPLSFIPYLGPYGDLPYTSASRQVPWNVNRTSSDRITPYIKCELDSLHASEAWDEGLEWES